LERFGRGIRYGGPPTSAILVLPQIPFKKTLVEGEMQKNISLKMLLG